MKIRVEYEATTITKTIVFDMNEIPELLTVLAIAAFSELRGSPETKEWADQKYRELEKMHGGLSLEIWSSLGFPPKR